jgi:hypothetical protein
MVRVIGLIGAGLIAGAPVLAIPELHVAETGMLVACMGAAALFVPSLGLAICAGVLALLNYSAGLLIAVHSGGAWSAALLGIGLLVLLDATHYVRALGKSNVESTVPRRHLANLAGIVLVSVVITVVLTVLAEATVLDIAATWRPVIAAGGGLVIIVGLMIGLRNVVHPDASS